MVNTDSEAVRAENIEPLNPYVVQDPNQKNREDGTDHCATLSISATQYVLMASVTTTYKKIHPLHVALYTGSGYNVTRWDFLPFSWQRFLIRNASLPSVGYANRNPYRSNMR